MLKQLEKLSLPTRLSLALGVMLLVVLFLWLSFSWSLHELKVEGQALHERMFAGIIHVKDAKIALLRADRSWADAQQSNDAVSLETARAEFDLATFLWTPGFLSGHPVLEVPG